MTDIPDQDVTQLVHRLIQRGLTIATAESLTGGLVCATLVNVPGASNTVRGGICTYATDLKASVLGVSPDRLALSGPVVQQVAEQMAAGVRTLLNADIGVSTTGVAGPGALDGRPAGTVHCACVTPARTWHRLLHLSGSRDQIRHLTVKEALGLVAHALE